MSSAPRTFLFGDYRIVTAASGRSRRQHTFGGPHDRKGASREDCKGLLIHLLHRLDLTDPLLPIAIPGVRWLPFYYCFDFRANDLGYQLVSDEQMVTFFPQDDPNVSKEEAWPGDDYPLEFPKSSLEIAPFDYDPVDLEDAYRWAGVFGIGRLSEHDRAAVKRRVTEECEEMDSAVPETEEEFEEALSSPFMQGKPDSPCIHPQCSLHKTRGRLKTIAIMPAEPVRKVHTFGEHGAGVILIFQLCPQCYTIRVHNQCS